MVSNNTHIGCRIQIMIHWLRVPRENSHTIRPPPPPPPIAWTADTRAHGAMLLFQTLMLPSVHLGRNNDSLDEAKFFFSQLELSSLARCVCPPQPQISAVCWPDWNLMWSFGGVSSSVSGFDILSILCHSYLINLSACPFSTSLCQRGGISALPLDLSLCLSTVWVNCCSLEFQKYSNQLVWHQQ